MALAHPLDARAYDVASVAGRLVYYASRADTSNLPPILLIHSVNAAASAYEVKPFFDLFAASRNVYALELPGFGRSDRSDRAYTVRLMTDAVLAMATKIRQLHDGPIDAIALSLSCEFLARAAYEKPDAFRSLGMISPTGFEGKARDETEGTKGKAWLRRMLDLPWIGKAFWSLLTTKPVIRKFLEKTWGSKNIDTGLLEYDLETTHQPGARHAPYYFVSGYLFSNDILHIYQSIQKPVWMVHGTRGDFVDYHLKKRVEHRPNWTIEVMPTGAFPHFERLELVAASYANFVQAAGMEMPPVGPQSTSANV
jgi:pimeloyl-ACP methyl ester carboxylesterase